MNRLVRPFAFASAVASLALAAWAFQPETKPAPKEGEKQKESQPAKPEGAPKGGQPGERGPGGPDGRPRGPGGPGGREGFGADAGMKMMNRAMKSLKGQVSDASKKDDNLRLVGEMQRGCVTAKGATLPPDVLKRAKDDAEKAKWQKDYRTTLLATLRKLIDVEQAILDGKGADADKLLAEIAKTRDEMHKTMGVDED